MEDSFIELLTCDLDTDDPRLDPAWLSADERSRATRFSLALHRVRYLRGRAALRAAVGASLGLHPAQVPLETTAMGKPVLPQGFDLGFSLSHCEQRCVVVLGRGRSLGVDVERIRPVAHVTALIERHFSQAERQQLEAAAPEQQLQLFFQCWTRKEAWLKQCGQGLRGGTASVDVGVRNDSPVGVAGFIHSLELSADTVVSIASDRDWSSLRRVS